MVNINRRQNEIIISFQGTNRFNCFIADELEKHLPVFIKIKVCIITIDFQEIDFIDTSGFKFLIKLAVESREHDFTYKLCNLSEEVRELINRVDMSEIVLDETLVEALPIQQ